MSSDSGQQEISRLAESAATGDKRAARRLIDAVSPRMELFLRRKGLAWEDIEDLAQEAWLRIFKHLDDYDPKRGFLNWAFTITRNVWLDKLRGQGKLPPHEPFLNDPIERDPSKLVDWLEIAHTCLAKLSEEYRTIFLLRFRDGFSLVRIAEELALSESSVRAKCCRAVHNFLDCVRQNETRSDS